MGMELKLKRCPFCGNDASDLCSNYSHRMRTYFVWVECGICGARSKAVTSSDDLFDTGFDNRACQKVISAWNARCSHAE